MVPKNRKTIKGIIMKFENGQKVIYIPNNVQGYILEKRVGTDEWVVLVGTDTFYIKESNLKEEN